MILFARSAAPSEIRTPVLFWFSNLIYVSLRRLLEISDIYAFSAIHIFDNISQLCKLHAHAHGQHFCMITTDKMSNLVLQQRLLLRMNSWIEHRHI